MKIENTFIEGPITPEFIMSSIISHQAKHDIGAHQIFLGQVRADKTKEEEVIAINFSSYQELAFEKIKEIREDAFSKYDLKCMHIYHSMGSVPVGGFCLFVFVSAKHRTRLSNAIEFLVDRIKEDVPIFGKEILADQSHRWKVNKQTICKDNS